jgi:hypothetical protein
MWSAPERDRRIDHAASNVVASDRRGFCALPWEEPLTPQAISASEIESSHRAGRLLWPADKLKEKALQIRRDIVTLLAKSQTGTPAGRSRAPTSARRCSSTS